MSKDVKFLGDIKAINSNGEEYSINERFQTVESSLSGEVSRAQTIEAGLQGQITANAEAIEKLTNGVSAEEIDSVVDLINYVNDHGSEVEGIQEDIKELQEGINDKADKATTLDGYGITDTYNQTEIDNKLKDTKNYTDTQIQKIGESGFVPVQSDWNETDSNSFAYIENKPTLGSVALENVVPISKGGTGEKTLSQAKKTFGIDIIEALVYGNGTKGLSYSIKPGGTTATCTSRNNIWSVYIRVASHICGYPVTSIGEYAFANTEQVNAIETLAIPNTVTEIEAYAFENAYSQEIAEDGSFERQNGIEYINIPKSVTKIGIQNSSCCKQINYEGTEEDWYNIDGWQRMSTYYGVNFNTYSY